MNESFLQLISIDYQTANKDYEPAFLSGLDYQKAELVHKLVDMFQLAFYFDKNIKSMPKGRNTRNQVSLFALFIFPSLIESYR